MVEFRIRPDGTPVFLSTLSEISVRDRITPMEEGHGLNRRLEFKGKLPSWSAWVFLAEADTITRQPDGNGWMIGDREWYIDYPANGGPKPVVRTINADDAEGLLDRGELEGGILPKLRAAVIAARLGVHTEIGATAVTA